MAFWSDTQVADPKRQHRWLIDINAPEVSGYISYICKSVAKPKITVEEIGRATSELQSHHDLVCRLLLEKKKKNQKQTKKKTKIINTKKTHKHNEKKRNIPIHK